MYQTRAICSVYEIYEHGKKIGVIRFDTETQHNTIDQVLAQLKTDFKSEIDKYRTACLLSVKSLEDHLQYDNEDDEPSLESSAFNACKEALK